MGTQFTLTLFWQKFRENVFTISQCAQCGKMKDLLSPKKIFRQLNSLVISLVKTLLSRNFC